MSEPTTMRLWPLAVAVLLATYSVAGGIWLLAYGPHWPQSNAQGGLWLAIVTWIGGIAALIVVSYVRRPVSERRYSYRNALFLGGGMAVIWALMLGFVVPLNLPWIVLAAWWVAVAAVIGLYLRPRAVVEEPPTEEQ